MGSEKFRNRKVGLSISKFIFWLGKRVPIRCSSCPRSHCLELQRRQNASCLVSSSTILLTSLVFLEINIIVMKLDQVMMPSEREIHRNKDRILKDLLFILSDFYVQMIHMIYNDHLIL